MEHGPLGVPAVQQRYEDGDDHRGAAHEHARHRRFRGAFGGEDGEVEADHADGRDEGEPGPLPCGQTPQRCRAAAADEREQQDAGQGVAEELAARVRVVAEDAVGGEGGADEDAGERGEEGAAGGGGVHDGDARKAGGPV
ncbi:hypothetical protein SGFS_095130 [Streptomyces graminofaciens]|uniref:Uncharacterized protein n=1 Tax=Streptomyces graminofaciens TaxID=68212 RepID=A0ABN5VXW7_9ACTN|nr:hypothetical protein SGFS_095130 [Streptomyces graminofaciens]